MKEDWESFETFFEKIMIFNMKWRRRFIVWWILLNTA